MPHPSVSRAEKEMNFGWAQANPALFVQSVMGFQNEYPITDWRHHVDLSRNHFMKLIAVRRDKPFDSTTDYIMAEDSKLYLHEIGMDC